MIPVGDARKALGAYYTPARLVRRAVEGLPDLPPGARVLDFACGDGAWLCEAARRWPTARLAGVDIDPNAIAAARRAVPQATLTVANALTTPLDADLVVGNPPWGAGRAHHVRRGAESASAFVARALELLQASGRLCLLLPQALLEVKAHRQLREQLMMLAAIERIEPIGHFPGVIAPAFILVARREPDPAARASSLVMTPAGVVRQAELARGPSLVIQPELDAEARALVDRLEARGERLAGRASFILGVVTGGNRSALRDEGAGEPIVAGPDVAAYQIRPPSRRLVVPLERVQQAAPRAAYARKKVVYRFIAPHPVAAVDESGRLTLNSANALAVDDPSLDPHFVAAALNSPPLRFVHAASTSLPRVLRAHLEALPLPRASRGEQRAIARLAERDGARAERELDERITALYRLTRAERARLERCRTS